MKKIVFVDVDGTLVNYENHLPKSAICAIRKARENGHKVFISTGRSKAEVYQEIWDIGIDGMIGGNGSYIEVDGNCIYHQHISLEQCKEIVDWFDEKGFAYYLESNNGLFASKDFESKAIDAIREYARRKGGNHVEQMQVIDAYPDMIFNGNVYRNDVNKISYKLNSYQDYLDVKERFSNFKNGTWGGEFDKALFGDIGLKDINKAKAIAFLLDYLAMTIEQTIAIGDAKIDIPMLEYCNIGVSMGNGGEQIKKVADYITDDVDDDGLYKAFEYLELL